MVMIALFITDHDLSLEAHILMQADIFLETGFAKEENVFCGGGVVLFCFVLLFS